MSYVAVDDGGLIEVYVAAGNSVSVAAWGPPIGLAEYPAVGNEGPDIFDGSPELLYWAPIPAPEWPMGSNPQTDFTLQVTAEWVDYNSSTNLYKYWKTVTNPETLDQSFAFLIASL